LNATKTSTPTESKAAPKRELPRPRCKHGKLFGCPYCRYENEHPEMQGEPSRRWVT